MFAPNVVRPTTVLNLATTVTSVMTVEHDSAVRDTTRLGDAPYTMNTAIIIVDVQNDFVEGGALAVTGGRAIVPIINKLVNELGDRVLVVTTQDWHPANHSQFVEQGGPWPVHCVAGSEGSDIVKGLDIPAGTEVRVFKGQDPTQDGYSGFDGITDKTEGSIPLDSLLRDHGIQNLYVCGIATDYCVRATVLDAIRLGYNVHVVKNACVGVEDDTTAHALLEMQGAGAKMYEAN